MNDLMLDGNSVAGLLQEVFGAEMTSTFGTCNGCGAREQLGAVRVYRGAGFVLRCPHCDNVLARIIHAERRVWINLSGIRSLELGVDD